ncbi:arylsulfatase [Hyphococcus sp.]|uniref:arylsulfatase n=1 Tax=Hyphococcus sp. TaxID=2038636 RepID=UPI0035C6FBD6
MLRHRFVRLVAGCIFAAFIFGCQKTAEDEQPSDSLNNAAPSVLMKRPNILLIVADDLGYADLGVFGSEIPTPNIDALVKNGMLLTNFYANMACSPTRAMLMSGTDSHLAGLGVMNPPQNPAQIGQPGYEAYLNFRVASMANLLKDAGYRTYMAGKWHLGETVETGPRARGFEKSFISIDGAAHLGGLSWDGPGLAPYRDGEDLVTVGDDFYTTRFYTNRMIEYIEADRGDGQPFFAYLAYTAPHWPLQAPRASIEKFKGWYDDGYEALYQRRFSRMKELGFVPEDAAGLPPVEGQPAWQELTEERQRIEARKMEIYAAMVSDLDAYIGELITYLKSIGAFDNTFIFFMSDNGPEDKRRDLNNPAIAEWVAACCDNSYDNLGDADSYVMYGPNWARASSVAFYRAKSTGFEGGIHVPAFAHHPTLVEGGVRNDRFATVMDILPTFLDLAETDHPGAAYRGRSILPMKGKSLAATLKAPEKTVHDDAAYVGWELYGHRALRQGDWKIVWDAAKGDDAAWELYNIADDPQEQNNLSGNERERLNAMISLWETYREENGLKP